MAMIATTTRSSIKVNPQPHSLVRGFLFSETVLDVFTGAGFTVAIHPHFTHPLITVKVVSKRETPGAAPGSCSEIERQEADV